MKYRIIFIAALLFVTLQTFAQSFTYDANYRLKTVKYGNGITVTYNYDALGNRTSKTVTGATAQTFTITTAVTPSGSGTVTGGGTYAKGTSVELRAIANAGYEFSKWSDGVIDNPRSITVSGNKSYTAQFVAVTNIKGDVNSDGVVGIGDIVAVTNVMAGIANDAAIQRRADVNDDGMVGIGDIVAITNIMAGVNSDKPTAYLTCPDADHPHLIDLGLPSGTLWACCNVGASTPEEYGYFYAWGESKVKTTYNNSTYDYYNGSGYEDIGSDIAGTTYDTATSIWKAPWKMPTRVQMQELLDNCSVVWTTQNGVSGRKYSGTNGGSIFLPAAGFQYDGQVVYVGTSGAYWSSTLSQKGQSGAYYLMFSSSSGGMVADGRTYGISVRPVQ